MEIFYPANRFQTITDTNEFLRIFKNSIYFNLKIFKIFLWFHLKTELPRPINKAYRCIILRILHIYRTPRKVTYISFIKLVLKKNPNLPNKAL